jgi:hypothetical protein
MVEVLEYALVILASTMLAGFALAGASTYSGAVRAMEDRAALSGLSSAAMAAVEHGSAGVSLPLSNSTVGCSGGRLTLTSMYYSGSTLLPEGCGFRFSGLDGVKTFVFTSRGGEVGLEVG